MDTQQQIEALKSAVKILSIGLLDVISATQGADCVEESKGYAAHEIAVTTLKKVWQSDLPALPGPLLLTEQSQEVRG